MRSYGMRDNVEKEEQAVSTVIKFLETAPGSSVKDVRNEAEYRKRDVDLVWETAQKTVWIEVKGDSWGDKTENFFFETVSNKDKGTPGCFMYTQAHFIYYYLLGSGRLFVLPMPETRDWFKKHIDDFEETETSTPGGQAIAT